MKAPVVEPQDLPLRKVTGFGILSAMSTLVEIENAVESLPSVEQEHLLRWLQSRLAARTVRPTGSAAAWVRSARGSVRDVAGKSADELRVESDGHAPRTLSPAERAEDLKRWAASHERGPGLPDSAVGRDAIYD
jgi:hypothetical protein